MRDIGRLRSDLDLTDAIAARFDLLAIEISACRTSTVEVLLKLAVAAKFSRNNI